MSPVSYWIKQAQQAVNAFIRETPDRDLPCISCGTLTSAQWDAGHYRDNCMRHLNSDLMNAIYHKQWYELKDSIPALVLSHAKYLAGQLDFDFGREAA